MSTLEQPVVVPLEDLSRRRRQFVSGVVYLVLVLLAIYLVAPQFLGEDKDKVVPLLQRARPQFLALALLFESLRYIGFGLVARQIAFMLGQPIRRADATQMMIGSYAASRLFSVAGVTGFLVRLQFYARAGFPLGRTLGLLVTQNMVAALCLLASYLIGLSVLWSRGDLQDLKLVAALGWLAVIIAVAGTQVYLGLRPRLLERAAGWWLRRLDRRFQRLFRRPLYQPEALQRVTHDLAHSVQLVLRNRRGVVTATGYQAGALASDMIALWLVFQALQVAVEPGLVVAAYIVSYYAQLVAPTPGEAGAMEFAMPVVLVGLGLSPLNAATTTLVFRFFSFWLPIPFGIAAYVNLKRQAKV
ncbi:MAG: flippase-like domain-containing protein [Chloroflexi bacterium]|nr:flippase-like domain-containing protein [Chloroflexota bacterium]